MPWVRLDDCFDDDPRVAAAGPTGAGLLVLCLCYSNRMLSDGFIPSAIVAQKASAISEPDPLLDVMEQVGLWTSCERDGIPGFQIHQDFVKLQPSREAVEAERQAAKVRKERWKERQRNAIGTGEERRSERDGNADGTGPPIPIPISRSRRTAG